jgi:3-hydroxyisobutyrate dehydrogenase
VARVAFVGLGTMGVPIAGHLARAGHDVVGVDVLAERVEAAGIAAAPSPAAAVAGADVAFTSLPSPDAVRDVWLGADGLAAGAGRGTLLVDVSTGPPRLARELATELEPRGLDVLDAPVSGGPHGAADGSLTVMVGGRDEAFGRARPLLESFGRLVVHVGGHGAGQAAKLCNNLVAGVTMAGLAEACAIGDREGLDAATLYALLAASTGDSRVLRTRFPLAGADAAHPSSRGWRPLFALDLIAKDLELALDLAASGGAHAPVAESALAAYRAAQDAGHGALDYSAVFLEARSSGAVPSAGSGGA